MISFEPTQEEGALQEVAHRFAIGHIRPAARACEEAGGITEELLEAYLEIGLAGLGCPESCGGAALGARAEVLVEEELAWGDAGISAAWPRLSVVASALAPLSESVRERWLAPLLADRSRQAIASLSEASRAELWAFAGEAAADPEIVISGIKGTVFGAERAGVLLSPCALAGEPALVLIPAASAGLTMTSETHTLGLRAAAVASIRLDHVSVPRDHVLAVGQIALAAIRNGVEHDLLLWAARMVGIGRAAFEYASHYATQRTAFGKPIAEHQAVAFMVADMGIRVDCARNLLWQAAWATDSAAAEAGQLACSATVFAAEAAIETTNDAVQALGGHGYVQDHPVEKWMRDARAAANVAMEEVAFLRRIAAEFSA
jgi:acyl-CoA dehydrogenase